MFKIDILDSILLFLLFVSILARVIKKIIILCIEQKMNNEGAQNNIPCKYKVKSQENTNVFICNNFFYKSKNWIKGTCEQKLCSGYRNPKIHIDEIVSLSLFLNLIFMILDFIGNISTFILIIRTLIK